MWVQLFVILGICSCSTSRPAGSCVLRMTGDQKTASSTSRYSLIWLCTFSKMILRTCGALRPLRGGMSIFFFLITVFVTLTPCSQYRRAFKPVDTEPIAELAGPTDVSIFLAQRRAQQTTKAGHSQLLSAPKAPKSTALPPGSPSQPLSFPSSPVSSPPTSHSPLRSPSSEPALASVSVHNPQKSPPLTSSSHSARTRGPKPSHRRIESESDSELSPPPPSPPLQKLTGRKPKAKPATTLPTTVKSKIRTTQQSKL